MKFTRHVGFHGHMEWGKTAFTIQGSGMGMPSLLDFMPNE